VAFTVNEFEDLIHIIDTNLEWRSRLRRALFPEIDVAKALFELAEAQVRTEAGLQRLEKVVAEIAIAQTEMQRDLHTLKQDVGVLKQDVGVLKRDNGELKGLSLETYYRNRAPALFGRYLTKGRDATQRVVELLNKALAADQISDDEYDAVLAADLLWGGEDAKTQQSVILVMEASWQVSAYDISRAAERAAILRRLGVNALPVAGGKEWTDEARRLAQIERVVTTTNGVLDRTSWPMVQPV
jgi:hypothetical protein